MIYNKTYLVLTFKPGHRFQTLSAQKNCLPEVVIDGSDTIKYITYDYIPWERTFVKIKEK